jgi:hypothetical protein
MLKSIRQDVSSHLFILDTKAQLRSAIEGHNLVSRLRFHLGIKEDEMSDAELLDITKGTTLNTKIRFALAFDKFVMSIMHEVKKELFKNSKDVG